MGHEVRELKSSRLTISITEQLKQEQLIRQNTEHDFTEMESILKKRILFLEQYKAAVGLKMVKISSFFFFFFVCNFVPHTLQYSYEF